jgi:hypothetical protein
MSRNGSSTSIQHLKNEPRLDSEAVVALALLQRVLASLVQANSEGPRLESSGVLAEYFPSDPALQG